MISKVAGIKVAERVFSILDNKLEFENENGNKLFAYLQTFNNCREQGYYLTVSDYNFGKDNRVKDNLYIYVCEARSSDDIMVVVQTEYPGDKGMFSEKAYNSYNCESGFDYTKYFHFDAEHKVANHIYETIRKFFKL